MNQSVLDTFWCGLLTGCLLMAFIYSITERAVLSAIVSGSLLVVFISLSIYRIRLTSKEKTINQIIIRHLTEKDMTEELKKLDEVD